MNNDYKYLGKGRPLVDGKERVAGFTQYAADVKLPNMLHAKLILSPYAHATIGDVDKADAEAMAGVIGVFMAEDLPTRDVMMTSRNSAILAKGKVMWVGQPVAVVVAESAVIASDAADLVFIDYDPLPAVASILDAVKADAPTVWPNGLPKDDADMGSLHGAGGGDSGKTSFSYNNVLDEDRFEHGDVSKGFAESDIIVENTYHIPALHQAYMEPHACVAEPTPFGDGLTIYTGTQGKFGVRDDVAKFLNLPKNKVIVKTTTIGGGFGAKYGLIEPLTASLALAVNQPVSLVFSRSEDFLNTTPAPEMVIEIKTGAKKDGTLTTLQANIYSNNGAFKVFGHSGIASTLMSSWYKWEHITIDAYEVHAHIMPDGAYRAPGAPQAAFAVESNIDEIVRELGADAIELRLKNVVESGSLWSNRAGENAAAVTFKETLEALQAHDAWQNQDLGENEGIGIAIAGWGTATDTGEAACRVDSDGSVNVDVGHTDVSNNNSSFVLVVAEALGVSPDKVNINASDTTGSFGPSSGGSRVTYAMAGAVDAAAKEARAKLMQTAADKFEANIDDIELIDGNAQVKGTPSTAVPIGELVTIARQKAGGTGPIVGQGNAAPDRANPAVSAHLIKVHVDPTTGQVTPLRYVMAQDVGFALNPLMVDGQLHGGMAQGIGMALNEAFRFDEDGQLMTGSFMDYDVPFSNQLPPMETIIVQTPAEDGPFGLRGVGEPPIMGALAATANAIKAAVGVRLTKSPFTAESVWLAMKHT